MTSEISKGQVWRTPLTASTVYFSNQNITENTNRSENLRHSACLLRSFQFLPFFQLGVTLEDLYKGKTRKLAINRDVVCGACDGKGGSKVEKCTICNGRGMKVMTKQIGPGMIQQMQCPCDKCESKGEIVSDAHKCKVCKGKKTQRDKKIIEVSLNGENNHQ